MDYLSQFIKDVEEAFKKKKSDDIIVVDSFSAKCAEDTIKKVDQIEIPKNENNKEGSEFFDGFSADGSLFLEVENGRQN